MVLYEATNGSMGYAYVRLYVWVEKRINAMRIAKDAFAAEGRSIENIKLRCLIDTETSTKPFCTKPSDEGWDVE